MINMMLAPSAKIMATMKNLFIEVSL